MRTTEQIVDHVRFLDENGLTDLMGTERARLVSFLPFEQAKPWLVDSTTERDWEVTPLHPDHIKQKVREYLGFAFDKAEGHRGLSAGRSISHLRALFWLLEDEEYVAACDDVGNYPQYGVPLLVMAAERVNYDVNLPEALLRMAKGLFCEDDCAEGCGK